MVIDGAAISRWLHRRLGLAPASPSAPPRLTAGRASVVLTFVAGSLALLREFASRKSAERKLEKSEDRLEALVNGAVDAIITIDSEGGVETFNPAAERLFGYAAGEAIGRNVALLIPDFHRERDRYVRAFRETGAIGALEVEARRKDRTVFPVELKLNESDRGKRFIGIVRDITVRRKLAEELARSRDTLRSLSARLLTAEQSERRRIASELHDDFSQRLALLAIDVEALKSQAPSELPRALEGIERRIATLADDVHRLAYDLHPSVLDHLGLSAALRRFAGEFSARHGIAVDFRERGLPGNPDATTAIGLYRIAQEALGNVAKHSKSASVSVRLTGTPRRLRLSICDSGEGFDLGKARREGQTLGLTTMEERVRMAGGTLAIRSKPGRGTMVTASLPRRASPR